MEFKCFVLDRLLNLFFLRVNSRPRVDRIQKKLRPCQISYFNLCFNSSSWTSLIQFNPNFTASWSKKNLENILKGILDSISSPSKKIQIISGNVCLRCKGKTLLCDVNKIFVFKSLLTTSNNILPLHLSHP